ncbi:MAG TPA: hypothetical protein DCE41_13385 [Cytophagales bacterium]|nr:hypothetical protein [Cytophagales bacterium]HAA22440.1 hypothetical protein [Cytophagales bacterium]HAP59758.1 hypothetical protein [Cytophagales bacterium]
MNSSAPRFHEIDALRVIALGLLIFYHIFISYQPFANGILFIQYGRQLTDYWFVGELLNIWRIPVLFVISGMSVSFMLPRRTVKELLKDRMIRLLPPLFFGSLFLVPIQFALFQRFNGMPLQYWPNQAHLWFLINLVVYVLVLTPLLAFARKNPDYLLLRGLRKILPWGLLVIFPLPLVIASLLAPPEEFSTFTIRFGYGGVSFLMGFVLQSVGEKFWPALRKVCHVALPLAFLLYLARLEFISLGPIREYALVTTSVESGMWMLAFLGYGSLLLRQPRRVFQYLSKAVFPIYIIHLPIQQAVAFFLFPVGLAGGATLALHILLTFGICFLTYEFGIRRIKVLYPVMGLKNPSTSTKETPTGWHRLSTGFTLFVLAPITVLVQVDIIMDTLEQRRQSANRPENIPPSAEPVAFGGHYYQVFERELGITWQEAKAQCESLGGHLVIINSAEENDFLSTLGAANSNYFLGASDHEVEGEWQWVDGTPFDYANWAEGEPNNSGEGEDYLTALYILWPFWNDGGEMAAGFICEWDSTPESSLLPQGE